MKVYIVHMDTVLIEPTWGDVYTVCLQQINESQVILYTTMKDAHTPDMADADRVVHVIFNGGKPTTSTEY